MTQDQRARSHASKAHKEFGKPGQPRLAAPDQGAKRVPQVAANADRQ